MLGRLLLGSTLIIGAMMATTNKGKQAIPLQPGAYLAINALAYEEGNDTETPEIIRRRLELNWYGIDQDSPGDIEIGLFNQKPIDSLSAEEGLVLIIDPRDYPEGFYVTDIQLPIMDGTEVGYSSQCVFPYWIRLQTSQMEGLTESRCLQSQPEWMKDNEEALGPMPLGDLMLVAAHDAASYRQFNGTALDNWITAIVFTQEEDLQLQLQWGVRFQDMRIGYYPSTEERFWLVHGVARERPLAVGLALVQEFLRNSRDIIVWDSHSFEQEWDDAAHEEFKAILRDAFGRWWVEPMGQNWNLTLNEIWQQQPLPENEGRIVLMYEDEAHFDPTLYFTNTIERWGNKDDPNELRQYLEEVTEDARSDPASHHPWRPNCQMTPTAPDVIFQKYSGLREMADVVNRNVTLWWRTDYSDLANVHTLHDYFMATDMIQVAIERNLEMAAAAIRGRRKTESQVRDNNNFIAAAEGGIK